MSDNIAGICQKMHSLYSLTGVPMGLFSTDASFQFLVPTPGKAETDNYRFDILEELMEQYNLQVLKPVVLGIDGSALFCLLKPTRDLLLILGPAATHESDMHKYISFMERHFSPSLASYHLKLLSGAPRVDLHYFCNIVIHAMDYFCQKPITSDDIRFGNSVDRNQFGGVDQVITHMNISVEQLSFEKDIYEYVKKGDTQKLKTALDRISLSSYYFFMENGSPYLRMASIFYSAILCHYASLGGLPIPDIKKLLGPYYKQLNQPHEPAFYWKLLPQFAMQLCQQVHDHHYPGYASDILNECISYIHDNLYANITMHDLETCTHATIRTITRHFRKYLDMTPAKYISDKKLEEAAYLLRRSDLKIVEIAQILQYSSQTHLNKNFIQKYNCTPLQYRKNQS